MNDEILNLSAAKAAALIRERELSIYEVVEANLKELDRVKPRINAITERAEDALGEAKRLDKQHPGKGAPALYGVPVTTKINTDHAGFANSNGLGALRENICEHDAPVVANLRQAGAITIGRTNTPEFSMRWFTSNPLHGVSLNPWDSAITPGGSSGAAAAAVACRLGSIAHGNDLGGSLRYPAYCCGVATIRPSLGRVPAFNPSMAAERPPITQSMSVQGPIARNVEDLRLALGVMSARSPEDPLWVNAPNNGRVRDGKTKIGYSTHPFDVDVSDEAVHWSMKRAIDALKEAGCELVEIDFPHADKGAKLWGDILFAETKARMGEAIREHGSAEMKRLFDAYMAYADELDLPGFIDALAERIGVAREVSRMFERVDLFLMPVSLLRPMPNDLDFHEPEKIPMILDAQKPLQLVNLLGLPSVALPTGLYEGLPAGVQLIGPMHDDDFVLDIAERLEAELGTIWQQLAAKSSSMGEK